MRSSMRLVTRLAWRNLRHRPWQAVLLLLALCLATSTLSLAMGLSATGDGAWDRAWRATDGSHVRALLFYRPPIRPPEGAAAPALTPVEMAAAQARLSELAGAPGVVAAGRPVPELTTSGDIGGNRLDLIVLVRDAAPAAVDQPLVTAGEWLDSGDGVVLEDGFAATLGVKPGDTVTVAGQRLPVRGAALTVSFGRYPLYNPARVWVNAATAARLRAAGATDVAITIGLRLADPDQAAAFAAAHTDRAADGRPGIALDTWQQIRDRSHDDLTAFAVALLAVGMLLALLTIATAAVLVAARMAAQTRQIGTLKAVGVTPAQITGVLLAEYLTLAAIAAAAGIIAGTLLSPLVAGPARSLYGAPDTPPVTWTRAVAVAAIAIIVVVLATLRPALRGVRHSTLRSLTVPALRPPRRTSRLARLAARLRLPLPAVLGLRSALRRPARTAASAAGLALAVSMVVAGAALDNGVQHFLAIRPGSGADAASRAAELALIDQFLALVYGAAVLLLVLAAINTIVVGVFAARDNARNHAVFRAVGATPRQTVASFVFAQLGPCLLACAVGIPLGVLLFSAAAGADLTPVRLSAPTYVAIAGATTLGYLLAVAIPARLLARQPVTPLLSYE
jgi:putative ABC transport system permease protein